MDRKKIIILILILVIALFCTILLKNYLEKKSKNNDIDSEIFVDDIVDREIVKDNSLFYTAEKCANMYFLALSERDEEKTYSLIDDFFIKTNNITKSNVLDKCKTKIEENIVFITENMYYSSKNKIYVLYAKGFISEEFYDDFYENPYEDEYDASDMDEKIYDNGEEYSIIIKLDYNNMTFSVIPNYSEDIEEDIRTEVEKNSYNEFTHEKIGEKETVHRYYSNYTLNCSDDIEKAYNSLDKTYREKRFKDINDYIEYVEQKGIYYQIVRYAVYDDGGQKQYVCIDEKGNYYIFIETASMQYTVFLDTYTIDLPEFIQKYNSATAQEKAALNVQKFMQAIDSKDYNYTYNCLSDGFKENYFRDIDEFKKYVEENFYDRNIVTYTNVEEESGLYKCTVNIDNADYEEQVKTKTFIVKLNEGTDFELSFNV